MWIPWALWSVIRTSERAVLDDRGSSWLAVMGRLRPGVPAAQAQAALSAVATRLQTTYPSTNEGVSVAVGAAGSPVPPDARTQVIPLAALLLAVTGLVLLIACANVANLLLARGAARSLEIAVRAALGASRSRLVRQFLTESAVLAAAGGLGGLLLSLWAADLMVASIGDAIAGLRIAVDPVVLAFTLATSCASVLFFGLVPALVATHGAVQPSLKTAAPAGRSRLQGIFVVTQLALSMVLLAAAGLSLRALQKSAAIDLGFRPGGVLTASYDLALQNYPEVRRTALRREMLAQVRGLPGVTAAGIANTVPLGGTMIGRMARTTGTGAGADRTVFTDGVGPEYFATLAIPVTGREFDDRDAPGAPSVAIVNETFGRRLWGDTFAIGRRFDLDSHEYQVVGVARDSKYDEATESPAPFVYVPLAQSPQLDRETLLVKTSGAPAAILPAMQDVIRRLDPALPVFDVRPFERVLADRSDKQRAISRLFAAFGALALALAAVGLYGVMAYTVTRRAREMGVRLALGATPAQLTAMIARDSGRLALTGAVIGTVLALPLTRVLGTLVFGIQIGDFIPLVTACAVLVGVALGAALLPARRAARLDPVAALRSE